MNRKQLVLVGGLAALAVVVYAGRATYPRWGRHIHQSGNRQ